MSKKIQNIENDFKKAIKDVKNLDDLENVKKIFSGKESPLNEILRSLKNVDDQTRKEIGGQANKLRQLIVQTLNEQFEHFNYLTLVEKLKSNQIDVSLPGMKLDFGSTHPLNLVIEEIKNIFTEIGYQMVDGNEVESDLFNFQKLNLPKSHPARDMQDTFYLNEEQVLRTHATNMTARMLTELAKKSVEEQNLSVISYGNVYRRDDDDATHSHQFMQIDGFAVGQKISFANLKWVLTYLCQRLFGEKVKVRLRPSYFPFTEPSVEVDISCFKCQGEGCALCKQSGWIEILGAGMINEQVLTLNGLNPKKISGLAFGIGIERIAMLKFGITNIRAFYENNTKFLEQFAFYKE